MDREDLLLTGQGSDTAHPIGGELDAERLKPARLYAGAYLTHQLQVVVQVMQGVQTGTENLTGPVQMVQIGARKMAAREAFGSPTDKPPMAIP